MLIKIFTLRFSERIDGFDDEPVRRFMADKEIVSIKEEFFAAFCPVESLAEGFIGLNSHTSDGYNGAVEYRIAA